MAKMASCTPAFYIQPDAAHHVTSHLSSLLRTDIPEIRMFIQHFLAGYASEEIQISTAETRISILPYQTLFVTGGWRHPALPNVPQTYPRTMIPVLRKLLTNLKVKREGGWAQAIFVA